MSHFTVLAITKYKTRNSNIVTEAERLLQPYHEFECTGVDDEYIKDIDRTEEVLKYIEKSTEQDKLKDALENFGFEERVVSNEEDINIKGDHKYGYAVVKDGVLIKVIERTNSDAKWDWYTIGGRWTGSLGKENPEDNPLNWELCDLCNGTGMRNDNLGIDARKANPNYTCNGCSGKGKRLKWTFEPSKSDISKIKNIDNEFISYAIITPDGEWYSKGEMGWFGVSNNDDAKWEQKYREIINSYNDNYAVLIDCHI